jgi:signal transduction histidine kinase/CheY-like chemotaxis protein
VLNDNLPLEARIINMIFLVGIVGATLVLLLRAVFQFSWMLVVVLAVSIAILILTMALANRTKAFTLFAWICTIALCDFCFPLGFFYLGGATSSISAYFIISTFVIFLLIRTRGRTVMLIFHFILIIIVYTIGYLHPEILSPPEGIFQIIDQVGSIIIIGCCLGIIIALDEMIIRFEQEKAIDKGNLLSIVNDIAEKLLVADSSSLGESISYAMSTIGTSLQIDRMYIWQRKREADVAYSQLYSWVSEEFKDSATVLSRIGSRDFGVLQHWEQCFRDGEIINSPIKDLTAEERERLRPYSIRSIIVIPVYLGGGFWGYLSFDDCKHERTFPADVVDILRSASLMLVNSIERSRVEQERADALEQALKASRAKGDFLSNMSHEMRTPMNAIIGMSAIGLATDDVERKDHAFGRINDASTHLLGVISDILDMSKIEADKLELAPVAFDFRNMLNRAVNVLSFRVSEKKQTLDVVIDELIPRRVYGDDQRLAQVIVNLLSNANKFTPDGGHIRLEASLLSDAPDGLTLYISVQDNGIGINDEERSRLFLSFSQAESGTSRRFGGTGLGLAISKRIVELMGGEIGMTSTPGKGSDFYFTVRLSRVSQAALAVKPEAAPAARPGIAGTSGVAAAAEASGVLEATATTQAAAKPGAPAFAPQAPAAAAESMAPTPELVLPELATSAEQQSPTMPGSAQPARELVIPAPELVIPAPELVLAVADVSAPPAQTIAPAATAATTTAASPVATAPPTPAASPVATAASVPVSSPAATVPPMPPANSAASTPSSGAAPMVTLPVTAPEIDSPVFVAPPKTVTLSVPPMIQLEDVQPMGVIAASRQAPAVVELAADSIAPIANQPQADVAAQSQPAPAAQPAVQPATPAQAAPTQVVLTNPTPTGEFAGKIALLAEDVEVNREIVLVLFEPTGLQFETVFNGREAVERFQANPSRYDLIIMDIHMPEMDGLEATRRIRAMSDYWAQQVPIIAMTANVFREDIETYLAAGMNAHIGKPIDYNTVLSTLRRFLN